MNHELFLIFARNQFVSAVFGMAAPSFNIVYKQKIMIIQDLNLIREEKWKTEKELRKTEDKLRLAHETIRKMEQQIETINEKMKRVVAKMNKIKKYALQKEMCLQYAFSAIVILVAFIIATSGFLKCGH